MDYPQISLKKVDFHPETCQNLNTNLNPLEVWGTIYSLSTYVFEESDSSRAQEFAPFFESVIFQNIYRVKPDIHFDQGDYLFYNVDTLYALYSVWVTTDYKLYLECRTVLDEDELEYSEESTYFEYSKSFISWDESDNLDLQTLIKYMKG
jgi:hypothetical protein